MNSDGTKSGEVVLHPSVAAKLKVIEEARTDLSVLIEERQTLANSAAYILADYSKKIGHLEYELYRTQVVISEIRFRVGNLQRLINRGEAVTPEETEKIDLLVEAEFKKSRAEIRERERTLKEAEALLAGDGTQLTTKEARELKTLYKRLCMKYHPDMGGEQFPDWDKRWNTIQYAYRYGDVELMRALANSEEEPKKTIPDDLSAELARLKECINEQRNQIDSMLAVPPFSYEALLADKFWVQKKQTELREACATAEKKQKELQALHDTLRYGEASA